LAAKNDFLDGIHDFLEGFGPLRIFCFVIVFESINPMEISRPTLRTQNFHGLKVRAIRIG
jgi:hypothetical protein